MYFFSFLFPNFHNNLSIKEGDLFVCQVEISQIKAPAIEIFVHWEALIDDTEVIL
jgi:hypothetical protein